MAILDREFSPLIDRVGRFPKPQKVETLAEALGNPVHLLYGRHLGVGAKIFEHKPFGGPDTVMLVATGEGEQEGPEVVWLNGAPIDHTDTAIVHFHPGLPGAEGVETDPATRNQKSCSLWPTLFLPKLVFGGTAYYSFFLEPDVQAPQDGFRLLSILRGLRMRTYDNGGTQTGYLYTANTAWCALDYLRRRVIAPRRKVTEDLTSGEKSQLDFQAFVDWAAACDSTVGGEKQWECHIIVSKQGNFAAALQQIVMTGRGILTGPRNGKWSPRHDAASSVVATVTKEDILAGSLRFPARDVAALPNRAKIKFQDLDSGLGKGTISTTGTLVSGTGTEFTKFFKREHALQLKSGAQAGEARKIVDVSSDGGMTLAVAFSANQSGVSYGNPAADINEGKVPQAAVEDTAAQDEMGGLIIPMEVALGNSTPKRAERLGAYLFRRARLDRTIELITAMDRPGLRELVPGDRFTAPADIKFAATRDWWVEHAVPLADGSMRIVGLEYEESIYVNAAGPQQPPLVSLPPGYRFPIGPEGLMDPLSYHGSAIRSLATTSRTASTGSTGVWVGGATWKIHLRPGYTFYGGPIRLTGSGGGFTSADIKGRIKVTVGGSQISNEIVGTATPGNPVNGTVQLSGLDPTIELTIQVEVFYTPGGDATTVTATFDQVQYTDQDRTAIGTLL